jgi:hypothetical protein
MGSGHWGAEPLKRSEERQHPAMSGPWHERSKADTKVTGMPVLLAVNLSVNYTYSSAPISNMYTPPPPVVVDITPKELSLPFHSRVVISRGGVFYLLLEKQEETVNAIRYIWTSQRASDPYDVKNGLHPLSQFGLGSNGIFEVKNSPWLDEYYRWNLNGPLYNEHAIMRYRHIVLCGLDRVFELIAHPGHEIRVHESEFFDELRRQLNYAQPAQG